MKRVQSFFVPGRLPGNNEILRILGGKFGQTGYGNLKEQIEKSVGQYAWLNKVEPVQENCSIIFLWHETNKKRDNDNVRGLATKFIIDGLVNCDVFYNDGWRWISGGFIDKFKVNSENPGVEIFILEGKTINVDFDKLRAEKTNKPLNFKTNGGKPITI